MGFAAIILVVVVSVGVVRMHDCRDLAYASGRSGHKDKRLDEATPSPPVNVGFPQTTLGSVSPQRTDVALPSPCSLSALSAETGLAVRNGKPARMARGGFRRSTHVLQAQRWVVAAACTTLGETSAVGGLRP